MTAVRALLEWHDFYVVIGAAAGALIGSLFVVASLGLGYLNPNRTSGMRVFLTPIIAHVAGILVGCALLVAPWVTWPSLEEGAGVGGLAGLIYAGAVCRGAWGQSIDRADRFWYGIVPPLGYAAIVIAAILAPWRAAAALDLMAAAFLVQFVAAVRNAWDMVLFLVSRDRASG